MENLIKIIDKYRNYRNVEMEFIMKNITKTEFENIYIYLESINLIKTEFHIVDSFIGNNIRITDNSAIRKTKIDKIDFTDFYINIKLETPIVDYDKSSYVVYTRTKKRYRFSEKYIYIDLTYIYESDSYEIEIEIDPILSLCHSSQHIAKKCIKYLHSFGANI